MTPEQAAELILLIQNIQGELQLMFGALLGAIMGCIFWIMLKGR